MNDYENGQLYGLEKFWAFLKYYKHSSNLQVDPKLKQFLLKFKNIEDFRVVEVSLSAVRFRVDVTGRFSAANQRDVEG